VQVRNAPVGLRGDTLSKGSSLSVRIDSFCYEVYDYTLRYLVNFFNTDVFASFSPPPA
jgi:hypothetical protein